MDEILKEQIRGIIKNLEKTGLELSGMEEVMHLLGMGRHLETMGDVFGFLEDGLSRHVDTILAGAADLRAMIGEG